MFPGKDLMVYVINDLHECVDAWAGGFAFKYAGPYQLNDSVEDV